MDFKKYKYLFYSILFRPGISKNKVTNIHSSNMFIATLIKDCVYFTSTTRLLFLVVTSEIDGKQVHLPHFITSSNLDQPSHLQHHRYSYGTIYSIKVFWVRSLLD